MPERTASPLKIRRWKRIPLRYRTGDSTCIAFRRGELYLPSTRVQVSGGKQPGHPHGGGGPRQQRLGPPGLCGRRQHRGPGAGAAAGGAAGVRPQRRARGGAGRARPPREPPPAPCHEAQRLPSESGPGASSLSDAGPCMGPARSRSLAALHRCNRSPATGCHSAGHSRRSAVLSATRSKKHPRILLLQEGVCSTGCEPTARTRVATETFMITTTSLA